MTVVPSLGVQFIVLRGQRSIFIASFQQIAVDDDGDLVGLELLSGDELGVGLSLQLHHHEGTHSDLRCAGDWHKAHSYLSI